MSRLARTALPALLLGALGAVLLVGALVGSLAAVVAACLALALVEGLVLRRAAALVAALELVPSGLALRTLLRDLLVLVFLLRADVLSPTAEVVTVVGVVVLHLAAALTGGLLLVLARLRRRRLETRGLGVAGGELPAGPPRPLTPRLALLCGLLLVLALLVDLLARSPAFVAPAAVTMAVLAVAVPLGLVPSLVAHLRLPTRAELDRRVRAALGGHRPTVVLYYGGDAASVYQADAWLDTLARLGRPALVLLRDRAALAALAPSPVPALCVVASAEVMGLDLPGSPVALYVSNSARNIHLLRVPGLPSAFIGHGDSDKAASASPVTRAYDQVWVAGEAGRDRYRQAGVGVGVRDEQIVLVGRPQLDGLSARPPRPPEQSWTVLYAPTWESWAGEPHHTSLAALGRQIVATLLAVPGLRVVFRPHPLSGTLSPAVRAAAREVERLLREAGPEHVVQRSGDLYAAFDQADALVTDVSSVAADFLATGRPYFVANGAGLPDEAFRQAHPTASAAYLVGPDASGLLDGLAAAQGADPLAERRRALRRYLLGDPSPDALTRFRAACDALAERA